MNFLFYGYVVLFSLSAVACAGSIPRARTVQHPGTRRGLVGFLASVAIWSGGYVGYLAAPTVEAKLAFYTLGFIFALVAVGAWLYFCAAYTGRQPRETPYRNVIVGAFLGTIVLKITNPLHNFYFTTEWTTEPFPHLVIQHQLFYWVVLGLSYALIAVGFFMLMERFHLTGTDSRPLIVLAAITAFPTGATVLSGQLEGVLPLMYEPPGVALFAVGTLFVYFRRFEAIRLTGGTDEPAIFLDQESRVRDYNQAAEAIFPGLAGSIDEPIGSVSSSLDAEFSEQTVFEVTDDERPRFFEATSMPFLSGETMTGQLVTITDVTDRETYQRQLEEKTDQLEALNRVVRHDIRNDMNVILSWGELLEEHVDEEGMDALDRILRKSAHVVELTDIARDFVNSLSAGEETELKPVVLRGILDDEIATLRDSYPNATVSVPDTIPAVSVQANEMLSSVFRNLFENAVQHTDQPAPEITVSCEVSEETVQVRVADAGPGVPDNQKETIFGKGEKGLDSAGTGIGLYLVNVLTGQFGGDVWVEDVEPTGAAFVVELVRTE